MVCMVYIINQHIDKSWTALPSLLTKCKLIQVPSSEKKSFQEKETSGLLSHNQQYFEMGSN